MKTISIIRALSLTCGLAVVLTGTLRAELNDTQHKTFAVDSGGQLVVEADRGEIEILTGDNTQVDIVVTRKVKAATSSQEESLLKDHKLTFTQGNNSVQVKAELGRKWSFWRRERIEVRYRITVPKQYSVDLKTAGGNIKVPDLIGKARCVTAGGDIHLANIEGLVMARTAGGNVVMSGSTEPAELETAGGDITVEDTAKGVNAKTVGGSIRIKKAGGIVKAGTSGGDIEIGYVSDAVDASTSGGNIRVRKADQSVRARTSGGDIEISEVRGVVTATTSGGNIRASMTGQPKGDCRLETSGGDITVVLEKSVAITVDAHCSGGQISSAIPITIQNKQAFHLKGTVNEGGPILTLRTSGGDIRIKPQG